MKHVFFLHIPKTGGISIASMIRRHGGSINPAHAANFVLETDWTNANRYRFFLAHAPYCVRQVLPRPLFTFTIFRDPIDREISNYNQILRLPPGDPMLQLVVANEFNFTKALTDPLTVPFMGNIATRMLGLDVELRSLWPDANAMRVACEIAWNAPVTEATYQRAVARLDRLDFVGFTERLEQDWRELAPLLGLGDAPVPFENAEPEDHAWPLPKAVRSAETEAAVRTHSSFDCRLYEEARKRFWDAGANRRDARHATTEQARLLTVKYQTETDQNPNENPTIHPWLSRIRQLEVDRDQKLEWAHNYKLLANSMLPRIRQLEDELAQKFGWAQSYRQLADSLKQQLQALEADRDQKFEWADNYRRLAESLEFDRDRKLEWAENYKRWMETEKARADRCADEAEATRVELDSLRASKAVRFAAALNRILRRLKLRR